MSTDPRLVPELDSFTAALEALTALTWRAAWTVLGVDPAAAGTKFKSDRSPVCAADTKAEAVIIDGLSRLFPGLPIVSEEAGRSAHPRVGHTFALVDPLDGTREYLGGRGEFTVNIAIIVNGAPTIGLIAAPALRTLWRGVLGRGAERLRIAPDGGESTAEITPIRTRPRPADGIVITVSRSHFDQRSAALLSRFVIADRIDCGSSLKFCYLAEGRADLYPRLSPICEWDVAAGHAVLTAAGGRMLMPGGEAVPYGREGEAFRLPGFLAFGDPSATPAILAAAGQAWRDGRART